MSDRVLAEPSELLPLPLPGNTVVACVKAQVVLDDYSLYLPIYDFVTYPLRTYGDLRRLLATRATRMSDDGRADADLRSVQVSQLRWESRPIKCRKDYRTLLYPKGVWCECDDCERGRHAAPIRCVTSS